MGRGWCKQKGNNNSFFSPRQIVKVVKGTSDYYKWKKLSQCSIALFDSWSTTHWTATGSSV